MVGVTEHVPSPFALRPRMLRTLLWLRWKLLLRGYSRSTSRVIGSVMLLLVLLPGVGFAAFGLVAGFRYLLPGDATFALNLLLLILTGLYVFYAIAPLMQFTLNEGLDITKLTQYPLSRLELMASLLIATLFDIPTLGVLLLFIGVGLGWAQNPAQGVVIGVILLLAYIHLVAISQLLLSALMGLLRTRRYRDLALVLFTALGLSCSLGSQVFSRTIGEKAGNGNGDAIVAFFHQDFGAWLQYLPPGMAGRAIDATRQGNYGATVLWLAALVASVMLVIWAWNAILARALATPEEAGGGPTRRRRRSVAPVASTGLATGAAAPTASRVWLPAPILAIATKDLRYYWREPQFKRVLLGSLYLIGILLIPLITSSQRGGHIRSPQYVFAAALLLAINLTAFGFGYEGSAVTTLALFPVRAVYVLLGKNLGVLLLSGLEMAILLLLQAVASQRWDLLPIFAIVGLAALAAVMGIGNVIAVLLPTRTPRSRLGQPEGDSGSSWANGFIIMGAYLVAIILLAPVVAAVIVPQLIGQPGLYLALLPLALLYGFGVYAGGTAIAAGQYYQRLPKIIEVVAKE